MFLAQGPQHSEPVRLEPAAPRSRVKHSATEPLRSHNQCKRLTQTDIATIPIEVGPYFCEARAGDSVVGDGVLFYHSVINLDIVDTSHKPFDDSLKHKSFQSYG